MADRKKTRPERPPAGNAFGYACQIVGPPRLALRGCALASATGDKLRAVAEHNLDTLAAMLDYNAGVGISLFRISSDIIPLASHPAVEFSWREACAAPLERVAERLAASGVRVSMHPGQYTVLNSPDDGVAERAALDLRYHADLLDALGAPASAKIVLHVGGAYGDKKAAGRRFVRRFGKLPDNVVSRLALENDERNYAIDEVHELAVGLNLPVIMDVFHHSLLPPAAGDTRRWLERCAETWKAADGRQKIHYSQQLAGGRPGRHSLTIDAGAFSAFYREVRDLPIDIMLEVKDKNLSALKCRDCVEPDLPRSALTEAWSRYKYAVLERDPAVYTAIRNYLKADRPEPLGFYALVERALAEAVDAGHARNAAQHVWGHLSEEVSPAEKRRFDGYMDTLSRDGLRPTGLKRFLLALAEKIGEKYLLQSLYFDID